MAPVTLNAQISKITTLADGTPRVYFDCQEGQTLQVAELMAYFAHGTAGTVTFTPHEKKENKSVRTYGTG